MLNNYIIGLIHFLLQITFTPLYFFSSTTLIGIQSVLLAFQSMHSIKTGNYYFLTRSITSILFDICFVAINQYMSFKNAIEYNCIKNNYSIKTVFTYIMIPFNKFYKHTNLLSNNEIILHQSGNDYIVSVVMSFLNINGLFGNTGSVFSKHLNNLTFQEQNLCRSIFSSIMHPDIVHGFSGKLIKTTIICCTELILRFLL